MIENLGIAIADAHFTTRKCKNATAIFKKTTDKF
jgi:hypothetical protein